MSKSHQRRQADRRLKARWASMSSRDLIGWVRRLSDLHERGARTAHTEELLTSIEAELQRRAVSY